MSEEREFWAEDLPEDPKIDPDTDVPVAPPDPDDDVVHANAVEVSAYDTPGDEYPLLSTDAFEQELEALDTHADDDDVIEGAYEADSEADLPDDEDVAGPEHDAADVAYPGDQAALADDADTAAMEAEERLRQPRAQRFRQNLRNQLSTLPLAVLLLALGGYLLAREQGVEGLPDLADRAMMIGSVLVGAFTLIFRALLSGRRERGLLFVGVWVWIAAGLWAVLVYGIDDDPDVARWWPLALWATGLALGVTYTIERLHDARLLLLAVIAFVAGTTAYLVTSQRIDENVLGDYTDYWPLLISLIGVGVLPAVFRRRTS
jgi:hypothetical protein